MISLAPNFAYNPTIALISNFCYHAIVKVKTHMN